MLSTQAGVGTQTDILPVQSIELGDRNQPQIFSLLPSSNSPNSVRKPRRKKPTKLDDSIPVVINPQITRTSTGVSINTSHHCSTSMPDPMSSFVAKPRTLNDHSLSFRVCIDHNIYDANNNINNNQIPPGTMPLNPSLPTQVQQTLVYSSPVVNGNPQSISKSQMFGVNQLLTHHFNERVMAIPSFQQNEYNYLHSSFTLTDEGSLVAHTPAVPSLVSPISVTEVRSAKSKRKYSKRQYLSASVEQQQLVQQNSSYPISHAQPSSSNSLPSIIPASVRATPTKSEGPLLSLDTPMTSSFMLLTPPDSIKSPPTNTITEFPLIPVQQHILPFTTTNVAEINPMSKQYFPAQRFSYPRRTMTDSSVNNLPCHFNRFLADHHGQYCMIPSNLIPANLLPMTYSSMLSGTVSNHPSVSTSTDMNTIRRRQEKSPRKAKLIQTPTIQMLRNEGSSTTKSLTIDISARKKRKHKNSSAKEIRTKKQLRRFTRQNRLAVLKFMMRKQKQQKQQSLPISQLPDTKLEQKPPELVSTPIAKPQEIKTSLPDIIASNLKISFDATQKIESIALYYHRRHKSDTNDGKSSNSLITADSGLGLLIEAVEFVETLRRN